MRAVFLSLSLALPRALADTNTCSATPGGPLAGPCRAGNEFCGPAFGADTPRVHIQDVSCGENDPNFPLYDPLHKLYHHFWQAHLATPPGFGPDIGHAVSADLVYWAHLPVAVWNDMPYDNEAIYTGSATIVDGVPTMVYPGLCNAKDWPACSTGTLLAVAVPADHAGDPLLTNWSKPSYNPIVESTQRDPSTAWQTPSGEWRLTNYEGKIFSSRDFKTWARAADGATPFVVAECPDFFPVPPPCTGNGCALPGPPGFNPTHVHKHPDGGDWYTFGAYDAGADGTSGVWALANNTTDPRGLPLDASQLLGGAMTFYASKSFLDPVGGSGGAARRIYWGWALVPPASTQTLPRVTTFHAALQRLIFSPPPELAALRGAALYHAAAVPLAPGASVPLSAGWAPGAGNVSETALSFALPATAATFGVRVVGDAAAPGAFDELEITYDPVAFTARVAWGAGGGAPPSYYMPGVDMPGEDMNVTNVQYTDPHICQAACNATPACTGFTYVVRPPLKGACCLKAGYPALVANPTCTSGVKPGGPPPPPPAGAPIPLLPGDAAIDVRVYLDNTFAEVFLMEGRVALTLTTKAPLANAALELYAKKGGAVTATGVTVWPLESIWKSPAEVLARRRGAA